MAQQFLLMTSVLNNTLLRYYYEISKMKGELFLRSNRPLHPQKQKEAKGQHESSNAQREVNSNDKENAQSMEAPLTPKSFSEAKGQLWKYFGRQNSY